MHGLLTLQGGSKMKHPYILTEFLSTKLFASLIGCLLLPPLIGWERQITNVANVKEGGFVRGGANESRKAPSLSENRNETEN